MTVTAALTAAAKRLQSVSDSPRLDAEMLLAAVLKTNRAGLLAHGSDPLSTDDQQTFQAWVGLRTSGVPVAYLTGSKEFHGFRLYLSSDVLIPRPATEILVDEVLRRVDHSSQLTLADIGTGSGAIALALAVHLPRSTVIATDISPRALSVAHYNARHNRLTNRITFAYGSLLEPFRTLPAPNIVVANLPYLRSDQLSEPSIQSEPRVALDGGADGLAVVWQLLDQLHLVHPLTGLALELDPRQVQPVSDHLRSVWPQYDVQPWSDGQTERGVIMWNKN